MTESSLQKEISSTSPDAKPLAASIAESKGSRKPKQFALGHTDFKEVVEGGYQFVDKTASIIKDTIDDFSTAKVIIRPPQFGKTSYLSTLRYFLDSAVEGQKLFQGLSIWSVHDGAYRHHQGQYAVIFLSLKDIKATAFEGALKEFADIIKHAYEECRQKYGFEITEEIDVIIRENATKVKLRFSLKVLIKTLYEHCKKKVVVLLDEYDTPLRTAYAHTPSDQLGSHESYYRQMCDFMDSFLGAALKDNKYLGWAALTGSLRPSAGEFSGFNNASVYSMLDYSFEACFGFSRAEVQAQLQYAFGSEANEELLDEVEEYYGGYRVADISLFDPWAITHFIADNRRHQAGKSFIFKTYVANVTPNDTLVKKLLAKADEAVKRDIMTLVEGGAIVKMVSGNITFANLEKNPDALWSFLLFNGYLTVSPSPKGETLDDSTYRLTIPNEKLWAFYSRLSKTWSKQEMEEQKPSSYPSHARFVDQLPSKVVESQSVSLQSSSPTSFSKVESKLSTSFVKEVEPSESPKRSFSGKDDFKYIVEGGHQLVDKTQLITEVIDDPSPVKLIIRPRQFGNTSNLSMLRYFFDRTEAGQDKQLQGLDIWSANNGIYQSDCGKYPVISFSLRNIDADTFKRIVAGFAWVVARLYKKQQELHGFESTQEIDDILQRKATEIQLEWSLNSLISILYHRYKTPVIVLIDEYDMPLRNIYYGMSADQVNEREDYYQEVCSFMDVFLGAALKGNPYLYRAVLTGSLPLSARSVSGIDNAKVISVLHDDGFGDYFGFSQEEVRVQLQYAFGSKVNKELLQQVEQYYGGYRIGEKMLFNPCAVIQFIRDNQHRHEHKAAKDFQFENDWLGSSREQGHLAGLLTKADAATKRDIVALVNGGSVVKTITQDVAFSDLGEDSAVLWGYMLLRGYLTALPSPEGETLSHSQYRLIIPNKMVLAFYQAQVALWSKQEVKKQKSSSSGRPAFFGQGGQKVAESLSSPLLSSNSTSTVSSSQSSSLPVVSTSTTGQTTSVDLESTQQQTDSSSDCVLS